MKIVLIALYDVHSFAIRILNSVLKKRGFDTQAIFFKNQYSNEEPTDDELSILCKIITYLHPDIIGFSLRSNFFPTYKKVYNKLRKLTGAHIIIGGHHATVCPEDCIKYADSVCIGEGEIPIVEFCNRYELDKNVTDNIPNILTKKNYHYTESWAANNLIQNLDNIPFDNYNDDDIYIFSNPKFNTETKMPVLTTRGCFFDCSFCYNNTYKKQCKGLGKYVRRRSVDNVIEEIEYLKYNFYFLNEIVFADNIFTFDDKWIDEFCKKFIKTELKFRCFSYFSMLKKDMLIKMKDAGCHMITVGFQSGSARIRNKIFNRKETDEQIIEGSRIIKEVGITARYDRIVNIPYEIDGDKLLNNNLVDQLHRPFVLREFYLMNHPKTPLTEKMLKEGLITEDQVEGNCGSAYKHNGKFTMYEVDGSKMDLSI